MKENYIDTFKFMSEEDEFNNNYYDNKLFVNPPFSKMKDVMKWIITQYNNNNLLALLIPVRTDTNYFKELYDETNLYIYFIKGRLKYNDSNPAPFPTMLIFIKRGINKNFEIITPHDIQEVIKRY